MNRTKTQTIKWILVVLSLGAALICGNAPSKGEGYMVRAILMERVGDTYSIGVLYQAPEAAANSADALASFQLAQAQGDSLPAAFQGLEQQFSQPISYQLSDYLLLCDGCTKEMVEEYAQQVQATQQGRYAAKLCYFAQGIAALQTQITQNQAAAQSLLDALAQNDKAEVRLYDIAEETLVMPIFSMGQAGDVAPVQTLYALSEQTGTVYDETQTQLYQLLRSTKGQCDFLMGEIAFTLGERLHSQSEPLVGVNDAQPFVFAQHADNLQRVQAQRGQNVQQENLPTLAVYALVRNVANPSKMAIRQMEVYLNNQIVEQPALLAQLGVGKVEVHLCSLAFK